NAQTRGAAQYNPIVGDAQNNATELLKNANLDGEREREKARQEAQAEIGDLAMQAAVKIVSSANSDMTDEEIYNEFLKKTEE
ncbi:MAG: hypothetical protein LIO94_08250, partial [Clostridiales bacterium]|nr:hypothetical protein [Clostridiales bacterium]